MNIFRIILANIFVFLFCLVFTWLIRNIFRPPHRRAVGFYKFPHIAIGIMILGIAGYLLLPAQDVVIGIILGIIVGIRVSR
jgi:hypothetical protein